MASIEQHPTFGMIENLLHQTGMQSMARSIADQMPDERHAQEREIADQIQNFVPYELIGKPEP